MVAEGILTDFRAVFTAYLAEDDKAIAEVLSNMNDQEKDRVIIYAMQLLKTALGSDSA